MSVGDRNSVDPVGGAYPTTGDLQASDPALAAEFQASLQLARQNMTAGQRYALNGLPWPSNQTATDASPPFNFQQPSPQTTKVPSPTNTPDSGRPTVSPFGWLLTQIGLARAAFQQLGRMQHVIENAPITTLDDERFDPDATQKEIMKRSGVTNQQELNQLIRNASGTGRHQPAGDSAEKPDAKPQSQPTAGFSIETRTREERDLVANMQALGNSNEEIQNALAALRAGHAGAGQGPSGSQSIPRLPANPDDLVAQGRKEISHPAAAAAGRRTFQDPKTGQIVEFDKGKPGAPGFRGQDHYHVRNPHSTGKGDYYLDKNGSPVPDGSKASHLSPNA